MPRNIRKRTGNRRWTDRRVQVIAGSIIAAFIVLGLVVPMTAMQLENHDSFCASCHTEGEVTFYQRANASTSVDLASFHAQKGATRCIDCHSGAGIVGRYVALTVGASDLVSYFRGQYPQPAVQDNPIGDGNCTKCHANVFSKQDFSNHYHAFLPRLQAVDPQNARRCVDCHISHDTTNDDCQKCHSFPGQG